MVPLEELESPTPSLRIEGIRANLRFFAPTAYRFAPYERGLFLFESAGMVHMNIGRQRDWYSRAALTMKPSREATMADKQLPSPDTLRQLLRYVPETGKLFWRERPREFFSTDMQHMLWNTARAHKPALTAMNGHGYLHGKFFGKMILAHRAAWVIYHGEWPNGQLDHINRNRADNRIANLRSVTSSENAQNRDVSGRNSSGVVGVGFCQKDRKWRAYVSVEGRMKHLGSFDSRDAAAQARKLAEARYGYVTALAHHEGEAG